MISNYIHVKGKEYEGKYYCEDCQQWFDDPDVVEFDEPRGEYWGIPCTEHMIEWHCPYCNSEAIYEKRDVILDDEDDYIEEADYAFSVEEE